MDDAVWREARRVDQLGDANQQVLVRTQELRRAQGDRDFHKGRADSLEIGLASHLEQVNTWRAQLEVRLQSLQDELAHARMTQTAPVHIGAPADVRVRIPVIGDMETTVELRVDVPGVVLARAAQQAVVKARERAM